MISFANKEAFAMQLPVNNFVAVDKFIFFTFHVLFIFLTITYFHIFAA